MLRPHLRTLKPYSSARDEFSGEGEVFLDANENPFESISGGNVNRYPDPYQWKIKEKLSHIKRVGLDQIFLGNGSDEAIDLLFRAFCEPGKDHVMLLPPTYGMYGVSADINGVEKRSVTLSYNFQIQTDKVVEELNEQTKLIFVCSPNNPTGNCMKTEAIVKLLENTHGLVVVDEAYIDFVEHKSHVSLLNDWPNLVILQTFS
ncbi:UNVERIFIED_CONTAM: hypothetical protein GTU68_003698, partial [Idotea baltica]|nr:hypothetical protein [Idotea baltica]